MTDFLAAKQQEINSRLAELQPAVQEYQRLEAAAAALAGIAPSPTSTGARAPEPLLPSRRKPPKRRNRLAKRAGKLRNVRASGDAGGAAPGPPRRSP